MTEDFNWSQPWEEELLQPGVHLEGDIECSHDMLSLYVGDTMWMRFSSDGGRSYLASAPVTARRDEPTEVVLTAGPFALEGFTSLTLTLHVAVP